MKALVVYYSLTGATRRLAQVVAAELNADTAEIVTTKKLSEKSVFPLACMSLFGSVAIEPLNVNLREYDLVVLGTPVWFGNIAAPMKAWLKRARPEHKDTAFLVVCGGNAGKSIDHLKKLTAGSRVVGRIVMVTGKRPESEQEADMRLWADDLKTPIL